MGSYSTDSESFSSRSPSIERRKHKNKKKKKKKKNKKNNSLDNPLMNMVLKHNKKDNKERNESIHGLLWSLPRVPPHLDVFSGNTKIGGLFGRYRFNKQSKGGRYAQYKKNKTFNLKIGGSKYNPLLEIWG